MKRFFLLLLATFFSAAVSAAEKNCGCACCKGKEVCCCQPAEEAKTTISQRHPLRGIVTAVYEDRSALMVKHEEIPGVMRAMTMLFKVDAATLKAAKKGQAITAQMSREGDDWWLHEVKPAK